jgi:putative ABC transport system substrate-binding protein
MRRRQFSNRREFISLIGGAAIASSVSCPLAAHAQQPNRMPLVGVLMSGTPTEPSPQLWVKAFTDGLRNLGRVEGRNLRTDYRWNAGDAVRARTNAAELVASSPDVIVAASTTNLAALQQASRTVPTVFVQVSDPVAQGFVASLARPGGNITGFSAYDFSMGGKWLDLLKQIAPAVTRVALIFNPDTSPQSKLFLRSIEAAAPAFGMTVTAPPVRSTADIEAAIEGFSRQATGGLIFPTDSFTRLRSELIVDLVARHRLPAISASLEFVKAGGLVYYGQDPAEPYLQAATYVDRILKGAKPGDLPVQLPTKFVLVVNLKAARTIGIDVPLQLQQLADEVIE